jgi:predicted RND superfamily exporter protein
MTVRVAQLDAWAYKPLTEHITRGIASHMDGQLKVEVTGTVFNLFTVASELLENLLVSFGWAFAIITALMLVLLRDLKLGLLSMIPNLLPIANVIGFMGVLDIPIDIGTLLIASIALGIAVDDTIHFFYHFHARYRADGDVEAAIAHTLGHSGRAMIATSIILMGGFLVYTAATMANLQRFGLLIALTVAFALLYDLIVSPALLRLALGKKVAAQTIQTPAVP